MTNNSQHIAPLIKHHINTHGLHMIDIFSHIEMSLWLFLFFLLMEIGNMIFLCNKITNLKEFHLKQDQLPFQLQKCFLLHFQVLHVFFKAFSTVMTYKRLTSLPQSITFSPHPHLSRHNTSSGILVDLRSIEELYLYMWCLYWTRKITKSIIRPHKRSIVLV